MKTRELALQAVITEIHATRLPERLIGLQKQIELGEAGVVLSDLGYPRSRTFDLGVCKNSVVMVNSIALQDLQPGTLTKGSNVVSMNQIAAHLGLSEVDIRGYVVVVRTGRARTSVPSCLDRSAANRVSDAIFSLTLAYSGGQPLETHAAVGNKRTLMFCKHLSWTRLRLIELSKSRELQRYLQALRWGGSGASNWVPTTQDFLGDNEYNWLGAAPIGSQTLWPGRFYFRLKHKLDRLTVKRDLSVVRTSIPHYTWPLISHEHKELDSGIDCPLSRSRYFA